MTAGNAQPLYVPRPGGASPPPPIPYARRVVFAFVDADLTLGGLFVAAHALAQPFVLSRVYDQNGLEVLPDNNVIVDANTLAVALASFRPLVGSWHLVVVG